MFEHLRGHVFEGPAEGTAGLIRAGVDTPTEVTQFQDVLRIHKEVLRFQVSVDEAIFVQEMHTRTSLDEIVEGFCLRQLLFVSNDIE